MCISLRRRAGKQVTKLFTQNTCWRGEEGEKKRVKRSFDACMHTYTKQSIYRWIHGENSFSKIEREGRQQKGVCCCWCGGGSGECGGVTTTLLPPYRHTLTRNTINYTHLISRSSLTTTLLSIFSNFYTKQMYSMMRWWWFDGGSHSFPYFIFILSLNVPFSLQKILSWWK